MVMSSSAGVYMFAFALITGVTIHRYEYFGYVLFAIGIIMMLTDPFAIKEGGAGNQYLGDIIAFSGALSGAIQGIFNSKNYKLIHPVVLMTHLMFGPTIVFSFDKGYGAFGWLADTNILVYTLVVVAPIFGFVNNVAFNISYFFWPMEIIAGAVLTQPFFSQAAGVMMGQDCMPGFRTIFGLTAITIGSLASSYGSRLKAMQEVQKICKDDLTQSRLGMVSLQNITS